MVVRVVLACLLAVACGDDEGVSPDAGVRPDSAVPREQVALVPVVARTDVDILYVIDDSAGMLELQQSFSYALSAFLDELARYPEPRPNLHIGVITTDLGVLGASNAQPGAPIGSGAGSCSGVGKDGALQTNGSTLVTGTFISDLDNGDGTRTTNYSGGLTVAFSSIASQGAGGCGFEQPLEAMRRALDNHPMNAGFLRANATLAIVPLQDEDDCSVADSTLMTTDTTTLGPLQSFRCTRYGVLCENGGATTDAMSVLGKKSQCRSNEASPYLTTRARYETFLRDIKPDPRDVLFMPVAAGTTELDVEERTPPGGGNPGPAVAHACQWPDAQGTRMGVADPAVRMRDLADRVARGRMPSLCESDLGATQRAIAREIRGMLGDACLTREIALPADCEVFDQTLTSERELPPCSAPTTTNCYRLVEDATCMTSHQLRVDVTRAATPATGTMVLVRCRM